ncbi:MAG: pantoate--beta-alanine ligase [Candidatus Omnitrophica bacterium]|nr:pantoate--beta-alanine ligase [Candidatus Omnitrophota bacterium]
MRIIKTIGHLRKILNEFSRNGKRIGYIPTMGYFHEGHLRLVRHAKKECDICVVSIYVNPKQFSPAEDLSRYPRDIKRDSMMIEKENVDILFIPSDNIVYPNRYLTYIDVKEISGTLCGKYRPGHFKGVATVVAKLLNMVRPDVMYLGQKDAQQVVVLSRMVADLNFPVSIRVVATAREKDGLAMSSRNIYLSREDRCQAPVLFRALSDAAKRIQKGERSVSKIIAFIKKTITQDTSGKIQYVACVDANTLEPLKIFKGKALIALAVFFSRTRLIDNVIIPIKKTGKSQNY